MKLSEELNTLDSFKTKLAKSRTTLHRLPASLLIFLNLTRKWIRFYQLRTFSFTTGFYIAIKNVTHRWFFPLLLVCLCPGARWGQRAWCIYVPEVTGRYLVPCWRSTGSVERSGFKTSLSQTVCYCSPSVADFLTLVSSSWDWKITSFQGVCVKLARQTRQR